MITRRSHGVRAGGRRCAAGAARGRRAKAPGGRSGAGRSSSALSDAVQPLPCPRTRASRDHRSARPLIGHRSARGVWISATWRTRTNVVQSSTLANNFHSSRSGKLSAPIRRPAGAQPTGAKETRRHSGAAAAPTRCGRGLEAVADRRWSPEKPGVLFCGAGNFCAITGR